MARRAFTGFALILGMCGVAFAADPLNAWLDVPFVMQQKNGCGPASIAMVMDYWLAKRGGSVQPADDAERILRAMQPMDPQGARASQMRDYFEQHGYSAFAYAGDWADLQHQIAKGRPLIAALKPSGSSELHYVVVAGINSDEQVVLLNDPAQRKLLKEDRSQFEHEWKATGFWTLLAVPAAAK